MTQAIFDQTALYRFFDVNGALLYVGITGNVRTRFELHRQVSTWWTMADHDRTTAEWYSSRPEAAEAERVAIIAERPVFNIRGKLTEEQERRLASLAQKFRDARRFRCEAQKLDEERWALVHRARELGIPDTVICQRGDISRTTLQRRLGYRAEADE